MGAPTVAWVTLRTAAAQIMLQVPGGQSYISRSTRWKLKLREAEPPVSSLKTRRWLGHDFVSARDSGGLNRGRGNGMLSFIQIFVEHLVCARPASKNQ